ncbi:4'-phosphopantetheinyl transferase family protein [Variovorax sp. MHTC-1]|uniref:4'-phosphopantetheinyl transferase family protein n=1 Tax=Variovorax sp. MHTC-1 TaxID=2495593 RepID=UPI000F85C8E0|nr:4'-phosphopantetheinyl transferase superfamily protein [Variovorax sp. MHTC-1]RST55765.1 4'-phosphopantetheinyl transferase superfamily protein [Variovorax sp. MHTC-1]
MQLSPLPDALPPGIEAYRLDLDLTSDPMRSWPVLTPGERAHAARFARHADRVRFAATRAATRRLLARRLDCCPAEVPFGETGHGKPFVDGDAQDLPLFNVTHSGAHAVIAIADAACVRDVGVDIERCDAGVDTQAILGVAFTREECDAVWAAADPLAAFYVRWVGKEAVLKAIGVGLAQDLHSIGIRLAGDRLLAVDCERAAWTSVQAITLAAPQGYAAALAWRSKE